MGPKALLVLLACCLSPGPAMADAEFRCGTRLIEPGMTQAQVREYCGEPTAIDVEDHDVRSGGQVVGRTAVYRWIYESYGKRRVLTFDQDRLMAIE